MRLKIKKKPKNPSLKIWANVSLHKCFVTKTEKTPHSNFQWGKIMKQATTITILPQKYDAMSKCVKRSLFETNHPCPNKASFALGGFEIGKRIFGAGKSETYLKCLYRPLDTWGRNTYSSSLPPTLLTTNLFSLSSANMALSLFIILLFGETNSGNQYLRL